MQFKIYQFRFHGAVHFGEGKLTSSAYTFTAERLFSALCQETALMNGAEEIEKLVRICREGRLRFSDAFPYCDNDSGRRYYVPKPMSRVFSAHAEKNPDLKKKAKKLEYIDVAKMKEYLSGEMDIAAESELLGRMGQTGIRSLNTIDKEGVATPFPVGAYRFAKGWGLYILVGYREEKELRELENVLRSLAFSGIGGKRSVGLGRFELEQGELSEDFRARLRTGNQGDGSQKVMSLSSAMPEERLEQVLEGASYRLMKRSGFVASTSYAPEFRKKKAFYYFKSGSVFSKSFEGSIVDVSNGGTHPVYGYYMPIFLEVRI